MAQILCCVSWLCVLCVVGMFLWLTRGWMERLLYELMNLRTLCFFLSFTLLSTHYTIIYNMQPACTCLPGMYSSIKPRQLLKYQSKVHVTDQHVIDHRDRLAHPRAPHTRRHSRASTSLQCRAALSLPTTNPWGMGVLWSCASTYAGVVTRWSTPQPQGYGQQ